MSIAAPATLADIEERFGEKAAQDTRAAANKLVQRQFLFAGDRGVTHAYTVLTTGRYRRYFETLFDGLGYRFVLSEGEQWVGLLPDAELADSLPQLRLEHTLVLLVLAHVWQEEVKRGGTEERSVVVSTVNEVFERYRDIAGRHRKEGLTTSRLLDVLKDFARRGLVHVGPLDPEADDHELHIRPMVNRLVEGDVLARLEGFAPELEARLSRAEAAQDDEEEDA